MTALALWLVLPDFAAPPEEVAVRSVPVEVLLVGSPGPGYSSGPCWPRPGVVVVSGEADAVSRVACVEAIVRLGGREDRSREVRVEDLVPLDAYGGRCRGVTVRPGAVMVEVGIRPVEGIRLRR